MYVVILIDRECSRYETCFCSQPVERGRNLKRPHFLSNANTALQFLQSKKVNIFSPKKMKSFIEFLKKNFKRPFDTCSQIKLVNINSSDLVDGRPPVVLGLIWTIILYFQVNDLLLRTPYDRSYAKISTLTTRMR